MKEIFKPVVFRNVVWPSYEVSNLGKVRSVDRYNTFKGRNQTSSYETSQFIKGKLLSQMTDRGGYNYVNLAKNGKYISAKVHRLVAETFIPNPENKPAVNHLNEDKQDNNVSNLDWVTIEENNKYGSRHARFISVTVYYPNGKLYKKFDSIREASRELGIPKETIKKFANNEPMKFSLKAKYTFYKNYKFRLH